MSMMKFVKIKNDFRNLTDLVEVQSMMAGGLFLLYTKFGLYQKVES